MTQQRESPDVSEKTTKYMIASIGSMRIRAFPQLVRQRWFSQSSMRHLQLAELKLADEIKTNLGKQGISQLFPIQEATYQHVLDGSNLLAKAHTGTGKTLAFLLPLVNQVLTNPGLSQSGKPQVLVVCPTRELASQVYNEIPKLSTQINSLCVYGGTAYNSQIAQLDRGVDIIVGTPGRLLDLIRGGSLALSHLRTLVLDESDLMLDIGFKAEIEAICKAIKEHKLPASAANSEVPADWQTLLFSATVPPWVQQLQAKFFSQHRKSEFIDLVGNESSQANSNISYKAIPCQQNHLKQVLVDVLRIHSQSCKSLIFVETRTAVDEITNYLCTYLPKVGALHGGIEQRDRERLLEAFRKPLNGAESNSKDFRKADRFSSGLNVLVATDVAARGIDISEVDTVIQTSLPQSNETFLHRSGRTARGGNMGTCIAFFDPLKEDYRLRQIETHSKIQFERVPAPAVDEVLGLSLRAILDKLDGADVDNTTKFHAAAETILETLDPKNAVASLLAVATNFDDIKDRSIVTGQPGLTSLEFKSARSDTGSSTEQKWMPRLDTAALTDVLKHALAKRSNFTIYSPAKDNSRVIVDVPAHLSGPLRAALKKLNPEQVPFVLSTEPITDVPEIREVDGERPPFQRNNGGSRNNSYGNKSSFQRNNNSFRNNSSRESRPFQRNNSFKNSNSSFDDRSQKRAPRDSAFSSPRKPKYNFRE